MTETCDSGSHAQTRQLGQIEPLYLIDFPFFPLFIPSHFATATQQSVTPVFDRTLSNASLTRPILLPTFSDNHGQVE